MDEWSGLLGVQGLAHVHAHGYVHNDVKPSNVFRAQDDTWRLGDFGITVHVCCHPSMHPSMHSCIHPSIVPVQAGSTVSHDHGDAMYLPPEAFTAPYAPYCAVLCYAVM